MKAVFYDHQLDGTEATIGNAEGHARSLDWQEIGKSEQEISYLAFHDCINGVNIWYNLGTDTYLFSDPDSGLRREYYTPSDSYEMYNEDTNEWFNNSGTKLRDPSEYNTETEGHTPFGDE